MLKEYEKYTETNNRWIYKVPAHWTNTSLRALLESISDKGHTEYPLLSVTRERGVILRNIESKEENHNYIPDDLSNYKLVKKNQFVINKMKSWQGSYGVSGYDGIVSPAYFVFDLKIDNKKYFNKAIRSRAYIPFFSQYSVGIRVGQWDLDINKIKNFPFYVPPKPEQDKIVQFLDWKTSEMNRFIYQKKKQIKLLKELKLSIIDKAVTKGIDNVELKYSGHTWIGNIPKHWNMEYSKHFFILRKDKAFKDDEQLTSSQQYGIISQKKYMELENRRVTVVMTGDDILKHVEAGDFVISMRSFQGGIEYSTLNGKISSAYVMLIPNHKFVNDEYYKWLFKSQSYIKALQGTSDLVRDGQALRYSNFAKVYLPNIPLDEQQRIADYLNEKTPQIDKAIIEINKEITLVEELRTKLISDVVTGQVDVRNVKIPAYETETDIIDSEEDSDEENQEESTE
mgnify:CR=1 FL=1